MRYFTFLVIAILIPSAGYARKSDPAQEYCGVLDQVSVAALQPEKRELALEILQFVAMGRSTKIRADAGALVGGEFSQMQQAAFSWPGVRVCAFEKIGEIGTGEALDFLANLKQSDLGPNTAGLIWPAAQDALANARLNQIPEPQLKITYLESLVADRVSASRWAMNQLCDRGSFKSSSIIRPYIARVWPGQNGDGEVQYCEARMQVVTRFSDRVKAIGAVLNLSTPADDRLVIWAMNQLADMHSSAADAELTRFSKEIKGLTRGSLHQQRFLNLNQHVEAYLERNDQRKRASLGSRGIAK